MIGVAARAEEHQWVREFFELFKTPWEFQRPGARYDVLIRADGNAPHAEADVILVFGSAVQAADTESGGTAMGPASGLTLEDGGERIPIFGHCVGFAAAAESSLRVAGCDHAVVRRIGGGRQKAWRIGYDLFQEVGHLLSHGQPAEYARTPTLDLHIAVVRRLIVESGVLLVEIPPVPQGYRLMACLTHDMDHPGIRFHGWDHTVFGFLYRATVGSVWRMGCGRLTWSQLGRNWLAAAKWPFIWLGLADDFWRQVGRYLELERGMGSTFFVIPEKHNAGRVVDRDHSARRASPYGAADIGGDLQTIAAAGHEIGTHGIDAWLDASSGRAERAKVASAAGCSSNGVRMHWLCFNEQSPAVLEAAGFDYDSTSGYNGCVGFRAGTTQVFKPPGANQLLELPLHVMDTALFYPSYLNLTPAQAGEVLQQFVNLTVRHGGVLTVNWHDRSLAPERLWDETYIQLLEMLHREQAWCPNAGHAVDWFRRRRATLIEAAHNQDGVMRVRVKVPEPNDELPGMKLRIYNYNGRSEPMERSLQGRRGEWTDVDLASTCG